MPKLKVPEAIKEAVTQYTKLAAVSKEAGNAANRQKTVLRNSIKDHWQREGLPIGSFARVQGFDIRYEANETSSIDTEKVLELWEAGEITREQFLRTIKVQSTEAKNVLGGDQVAAFTVKEIGKSVDIRMDAVPIEQIDDEFIMENAKVRKRVKRRVFGGGNTTPTAKTTRPKRRIKTRTRK